MLQRIQTTALIRVCIDVYDPPWYQSGLRAVTSGNLKRRSFIIHNSCENKAFIISSAISIRGKAGSFSDFASILPTWFLLCHNQ